MLENLELFKKRAIAANNDRQHDRMVQDKLKTLYRALLYSYQAAWIHKDDDTTDLWARALINPDKVKFDYDEKIVSTTFDTGLKPGDTFEWGRNSNSHWIVLKPEDTELAYFRANIRRCQKLTAKDPVTGEKFSQWCAIRGPVETKINHIQKQGIVADVPNLTLNIYLKNNEINRRTFDRYKNFEFDGRFWKVQAPDTISTPGVMEFTAEEDYDCKHSETIAEIKPDDSQNQYILGDAFVKPLQAKVFKPSTVIVDAKWSITLPADKNKELEDVIDFTVKPDMSIEVKWTAMISGSYILHYGPHERTIIVQSLF